MIFSRNLFLFAFTTATTTLTMANSSGVDSLDDMDIYRASNSRPPFHDDAEMLNTVLEISLKSSITLPESSLVSCESLSIQELDERLVFMELLKSKELDSMYKDEDYRKNPYQNVNDLQSKIEEVNNDDGDIFLEEDFQNFMKCRELVTSYVHRLSESNKQIYLKSKSLPKLSEIDNEVSRRTLEEDDRRHRLLCFSTMPGPTPAPANRVLYNDSEPTPAPMPVQTPELSPMGTFPTYRSVEVESFVDDDYFQEEDVSP